MRLVRAVARAPQEREPHEGGERELREDDRGDAKIGKLLEDALHVGDAPFPSLPCERGPLADVTAACASFSTLARRLRGPAHMDAEGERRSRRDQEPFLEGTQGDARESAAEADPYFPPTDPVVRQGRDQVEIEGGFSASAVDDDARAPRTHVGGPADEALVDDVRRALRRDASTADLELDISVSEGIATLRGRVADLVDTDNALAVAGRVPGISDVVDEIEVEAEAP